MATKAEKEHMGRVAALSCVVCRNLGLGESPAEVHHIGNGTMGKRASNHETIPLCPFITGLVGMDSQSTQAAKSLSENSEQSRSCSSRHGES
jgi:hypothetical protein